MNRDDKALPRKEQLMVTGFEISAKSKSSSENKTSCIDLYANLLKHKCLWHTY